MEEKKIIDQSTTPISGTVNLRGTLPNGKEITLQGYLYYGEDIKSINERLDILHDVMDRQRMRASIPLAEAEVERCAKILEQHNEFYNGILAKAQDGGKLSSTEKKAIEESAANLKHKGEDLEKARKALADAKKAAAA